MAREQRSVRVWLSAGPRARHRAGARPAKPSGRRRCASAQDGLEAATLSEIRSAAFPSDVVVAQDPPPNTPGSKVSLLVNRAEQPINYVMPDLIGVNGERAGTLLREHGLPRGGRRRRRPIRVSPPASSSARARRPGSRLRPGEPISIEVSR